MGVGWGEELRLLELVPGAKWAAAFADLDRQVNIRCKNKGTLVVWQIQRPENTSWVFLFDKGGILETKMIFLTIKCTSYSAVFSFHLSFVEPPSQCKMETPDLL